MPSGVVLIKFIGYKKYPIILHSVAKELAELRSKMSEKIYNKRTEKWRGDKEKEISYLGILGELVAREFLIDKKIDFLAAKLVDFNPVPEPDIVLSDGMRLDVKGVKSYSKQFYVNYKAHQNSEKICDFYWFVKFCQEDGYAEHYTVRYEDVFGWEVKELTYTKAYVTDIEIKEGA